MTINTTTPNSNHECICQQIATDSQEIRLLHLRPINSPYDLTKCYLHVVQLKDTTKFVVQIVDDNDSLSRWVFLSHNFCYGLLHMPHIVVIANE